MSAKRINFRCRPSTFRALLDSISEHFTKEVVEILRMLHIHQFIRMPATQQDSTDITLLMSCWNIEKQAFYVGGHYLPFTADEVALIIGMPNRGEKVTWQKSPLSESNSICFKNKIKKLDRPLSATQFVQLYIQFLISNLFFIYHNYRVASDLISYADNIDKFANYNWPEAIWSFLVSQFDMITSKILTQKALGYMSGFVTLLMIWFLEHTRVLSPTVPSAKPRMLRWSSIKFTEESISGLQGDQGHHEMKRSFPWKTVDFISLSDSDSDSEGDKQDRAKRGKKDYSSKNLKDITSEGALIRMAGMYQDYMKRTPIPTFSGSVIPFTSWQGLAKSLKQLYGQPLHYLTNRLLKQWDRERFGSDDEHQPLDAVIHPLKAQTLIWLTEELHRLTASPHHLAELWASDPMYHSFIDPFLSC